MSSFPQVVSNGLLYHRFSDMQYRVGCSLIDEMLKPKCGEVILDLGCGTGRLSLELAARVGVTGRVVGVDPDKSRIVVARAELEELDGHVPISFLEGSTKEAAPLGPFDAIFSNYVLHWFERVDRTVSMRDMYEMLKPGGRLVFLVQPHQNHPKNFLQDVVSLVMPDKDLESACGMKFDSASVWLQLCTEAGFVIELSEEADNEETRPNIETCLKGMEAAIPTFTSSMVADGHVEELKKRYSSGHGTEMTFFVTTLKVLATRPQIS